MKAYIFPGQGAQFIGMGKDLYDHSALGKKLFEKANEILGFRITDIMFAGADSELKQTKVTQPAIFLHSVILSKVLGDSFKPEMASGHSVGELSALSACGVISFEDGLRLVAKRAILMQKACEMTSSSMAAILGLEDDVIESIISSIDGVVPANYNGPGQLVISGTTAAVEIACAKLVEAGARVMMLQVSGAFHSPVMEPAKVGLTEAIEATAFSAPICPVYQNVNAKGLTDPAEIKKNLIAQVTAPVKWRQTMNQMIADGCTSVVEIGPGRVLQGLFKKVNRSFATESAVFENQKAL